MSDITSKPLIVIKGLLFLLIVLMSAGALFLTARDTGTEALPDWLIGALILLLIWSSARFYYFLFYVLEKYVDPSLKYSGIRDLLRHILCRKG